MKLDESATVRIWVEQALPELLLRAWKVSRPVNTIGVQVITVRATETRTQDACMAAELSNHWE